jgi:flavin reductase (DIM6/NTAB) family NADH-FMN oxidoreductase RutF
MIHFSKKQISELPKLKRGALMNGIGGVKPLNLIGSISENGHQNLAVFNSIVHIGSNPPLIGFILRPTTVERHTYKNILTTKVFSVNQVNNSMFEKAHQTAASYDRGISEFDAVGLTAEKIDPHKIPFVKESKVKFACAYKNEYFIEENGCRLIIAEVLDIYSDNNIIEDNGFVNLEQAEATGAIGLDAYVSLKLLDRLDFARPNVSLKSLLKDGTS